MPIRFETLVPYGDGQMRLTGDDFREVHAAAARIYELDRDARFLRDKGIEAVAPDYREDAEGNAYYGFRDRHGRRNVTFGQNREKGAVPLFPKGEGGYYDPDTAGPRGGHGAPQGTRPQRPAQLPGTPEPPPYDEFQDYR